MTVGKDRPPLAVPVTGESRAPAVVVGEGRPAPPRTLRRSIYNALERFFLASFTVAGCRT